MSTLLDAAIVLGAGPPVICVRHRVCHTLCHSVCHSVPPCATVCQPPGASTIIWQTRANIQTPPSVNPVVTNPLLLGSSPIFEKNYLLFPHIPRYALHVHVSKTFLVQIICIQSTLSRGMNF